MTDKITLASVGDGSFLNASTAAATIDANNAIVETAFNNTLSRDGTSPNMMAANIDMNSNRVLNLPSPITANEPVRLTDLSTYSSTGTVTFQGLPTGGTTGQVLNKNSGTNFDAGWSTFGLSNLPTQANNTFLGNTSGGTAVPSAFTIDGLTTKASPTSSDLVVISDQAASGALKKATVTSLQATTGVNSLGGLTGAITLGPDLTTSGNSILSASGCVVGMAIVPYTTATTMNSAIPADDTIPQSGEGTQIITTSYTPKYSTSTLLCVFEGQAVMSAADNLIIALFNGAANSFSAQIFGASSGLRVPCAVIGSYAPGTTSAQTISVRAGPATGTTNLTFNGTSGGARILGGSSQATLVIYEIK